MISLGELLNSLGYDGSSHYHRIDDSPPEFETAYLFRVTRDIGVSGIYVFEASPRKGQRLLPARPAVYVAEAETVEEAREIHRILWNLSYAPFLIIKLPQQIRIYTGFNYSPQSEKEGLLDEIDVKRLNQLNEILTDFHAASIDTGRIWKSKHAQKLDPRQRVDRHLLKNLKKLGNALKDDGLRDEVVHALIGKYVYLHYLCDRHILSDEWLHQQRIDPDNVFKRHATIGSLQRLTSALEDRFNGRIFPIDFDDENTLLDRHVSWVASVFMGDEFIDTVPNSVRQLHLPFKAYDFHYIPVETLSAIYEQFISESKEKGAIYTPEFLADYLLSEVEGYKQLKRGMKILDPACGSGVFLVLAYRRLIEKEMVRLGRKLTPDELGSLLLEGIYGIERERDACYVAEFSLILTLLHYTEDRDLQNLDFQFPELHNSQIFECDFFDLKGAKFWQQGLTFDWIVGNPPWIKPNTKSEKFARAWIENHKADHPVGDKSVAEAFSWLVTDLLTPDGIVGLVLPATSLVNLKSQKYREPFFTQHEVLRITNFANLRETLFDRRATLPAATMVYRRADETRDKPHILHYAPLSVNQVAGAKGRPWVITINENEIQTISPYEAEKGETILWKLALWGTHRDKRTLERIEHLFPNTLGEICKKRGWPFHQGAELRNGNEETHEALEYITELRGKKRFRTDSMRKSLLRFSVPQDVLETMPDEMFDNMVKAKNFMGAGALLRQVSMSLFDMLLH
ncbi:MAG: N-6 DNA methylase, partial [Candidatus Poribacteria bacterium]|nr:N-6 DNA methylase [Candidatus Poribacteria bacterium]